MFVYRFTINDYLHPLLEERFLDLACKLPRSCAWTTAPRLLIPLCADHTVGYAAEGRILLCNWRHEYEVYFDPTGLKANIRPHHGTSLRLGETSAERQSKFRLKSVFWIFICVWITWLLVFFDLKGFKEYGWEYRFDACQDSSWTSCFQAK